MNGSVSIGRIGGVPLRLRWSAPLLVIVLSIGLGSGTLPAWAPGHSGTAYRIWAIAGALLLTASLLAHEAAHALAAHHAKIDVKDVTIFALGGVTRMALPASARSQGRIAAAGPATSLLLGGICLGGAALTRDALHWPLPGAVLAWGGFANILLAAFNLLPAAPLDGGRVLQAVIWRIRGDREGAARVSGRCGQVAGALMIAVGWLEFLARAGSGLWLALIGAFVTVAATAEVRRAELFQRLRGMSVADVMRPAVTGQDWQSVERFLAETAPRAGDQPVVPLTDLDGRLTGCVTMPGLRAMPASRRAVTRVRDVAAPLDRCVIARPDEPVTEVLNRAGLSSGGPVLVLDHEHVVGIITAADLVLRSGSDRRTSPPPARHADHRR
ncbi:site-2 protease family protein [Actinacidiphila acidipaludis]|uniref:Zinc metalloprotease n=1 Tax=Actinacidiphila acidipaludis TaxID=2873382 RepID=A0ABS7Q2J1_9ACTN|nr:site-2 protease family protein [Streptomyces acidipaludis]MBY8877361.1 site-2 protease family protein [Streptomyces acidipaludis]